MSAPSDDELSVSYPQLFLRRSDPLPPPIDGALRLVFLSDTHGRHKKIPLPLPEGDVLFHLGDAADRGNLSDMRSFVKWLRKNSSHKERIVIDGNHDREIPSKGKGPTRDFMMEYIGVARVLRNEVVEVAGGKMTVVGVTWDACESEFFAHAEKNIKTWSDSANEEKRKVDLVLSHGPPYVEGGGRGWESGSQVLSHFVKDINPSLHCFGHIHFARGVRGFTSDITMVNCATTWRDPVVIDYDPVNKRTLMIHCPIPARMLSHLPTV